MGAEAKLVGAQALRASAYANVKLYHKQRVRTRPASEARLRHSSSSTSPTAGTDGSGALAACGRLACLLAKARRLVSWQRGRAHRPQALRSAAACILAARLPKQRWRRLCPGPMTMERHGRLAQQAPDNAESVLTATDCCCYGLGRTRVSSFGRHVPHPLHVPLRALTLDVENSRHSGLLKLGSRAAELTLCGLLIRADKILVCSVYIKPWRALTRLCAVPTTVSRTVRLGFSSFKDVGRVCSMVTVADRTYAAGAEWH